MRAKRSFVEPYAETLRDVLNDRPVVKLNPMDTVPEIIRRLRAHGVKAAGVVGLRGNLLGMVTENAMIRNIFSRFDGLPSNLERLCDHKAVSRMTAWDVMIANPDCLHIDDTVEDAQDVMTYFSHHYMPVIDNEKRLVGIVDTQELKKIIKEKYGVIKSIDDPISFYAIQQKLHDISSRNPHVY